MMLLLTISTILLTCLTVGLAVIVFALARQIGVLHERTAPIGQQPVLAGLQVGQALPRITARLLDDSPFPLGGMHTTDRSNVLMFMSADCPVCKKTLPLVQALAVAHDVDLTLIGEGDIAALRAMTDRMHLGHTPLVTSQELLLLLQVGRLPTLVALDSRGVITARDVASTRAQVEAILGTLPVPVSSSFETKELLHDAV
ncbi:thioredoxin domain-containing protein [Gluconobacter frateurii]|uniref:Alkyl hydroperoxide reductase n=1 Tax=Gluconobacter frateurii NRIC 0228 TaxID=1307946 RepID=A0ABQ0QFJ1_9PROT|nr:alkyl hydroperoxide reductase [Gluconobacter frateurii]GBR17130.1 hypothetical protein AA0228_2955 [Gluconobacter frateurii NRIC 0228]GLP90754.1 hypothetical protein GCM10007868_18290 [Gluconobacter frateurii]